ncbi:MAG: hypothetical protein IH962_06865, partial [Chloroflexi bacterium]|nr:hypothetical protein [Chloroflexota bacterium]
MKALLAAALAIGALMVLVGCSQLEQDLRRTAGQTNATVPGPSAPLSAGTPSLLPTPSPLTPTSQPAILPVPSRAASVAVTTPMATAAPPKPQPTVPPTGPPVVLPPTPTPVAFLPFPTPLPTTATQPRAAPVIPPPTATPLPTPTAAPTATPAPTESAPKPGADSETTDAEKSQIMGEMTLRIQPKEPFAGRDVSFSLEGMEPWQKVAVEFFDPLGRPAQWITDYETELSGAAGDPTTRQFLFSDGTGRVEWLRIGTRDREGIWTVRITVGGQTVSVNYPVAQLQLPVEQAAVAGLQFSKYQGAISPTYYSGSVPPALVVDLESHLHWVAGELNRRLGLQSTKFPDIYISGTTSIFKQLGRSTNTNVGQAEGYYLTGGPGSGIYLRADLFRTGIQRVLSHEFVHLLLDEASDSKFLPAWLNEGTAEYYEYTLGIEGERPDATRARLYRSADLAQEAAASGTLLSLPVLENQTNWNSQDSEDRINLQYAQAHMAVRYLTETYGPKAPADIMIDMGRGAPLIIALQEETGRPYAEFERDFVRWLKAWQDPEREQIRAYTQAVNQIIASLDAITTARANELNSPAPLAQRITSEVGLVTSANTLKDRLGAISPPPKLRTLHKNGLALLGRVVDRLKLELEHDRDQQYLKTLEGIIASLDGISSRRSRDIGQGTPPVK